MTEKQTLNTNTLDAQPHVQEFMRLQENINKAVKTKDEDGKATAKNELMVFYGNLTSKEQQDIRSFLEQQNAMIRVERVRGITNKSINMLVGGISATAETIASGAPKIVEESTRLIVSSLLGIAKGAYRSFSQSS